MKISLVVKGKTFKSSFRNTLALSLYCCSLLSSVLVAKSEAPNLDFANIIDRTGTPQYHQDFDARGKARLAGIPLEVLVNKGSASASEIVAGALRDQLGAQLVGTQTFGKGTVQDRRELSNGAGIHITVARWMLPGGDWIHDEGIPVDVEVEFNPEVEEDVQLNKAIEVL